MKVLLRKVVINESFRLRILKHTESCIQFNHASYKCFQFQEKFPAKCRHTVGRLEFVNLSKFFGHCCLRADVIPHAVDSARSKNQKTLAEPQMNFLAFVNSL